MRRSALALVVLFAGCGTKTEGSDDGSSGAASTSGASTSGTTVEPGSSSGPVVTSGETGINPGMCPGQNNHLEGDKCFCDVGYQWCDPFDDADLSCCPLVETTSDETGPGTSMSGSTSGSTTGEPVACDAPPPDGCDPNDGMVYCQMAPGCALEGSVIYWCDGTWQVDEAATTKACVAEGEAFAFGCSVEGDAVTIECGHGPGTACSPDDMSFCTDLTTLQACTHGKLADIDCAQACKDGEIDGMVHESGYCMASRIMAACECCDGGNCP